MRRLIATLLAVALPCTAAAKADTTVHFPASFIWGTATAAVQVEGGTTGSDWDDFEQKPHVIRDNDRIGDAAKHYQKYDQDFRAAAAMNTNGYRCSIEWSRLEPRRGVWDRAAEKHYRQMFTSMRAHGLRPMVTLHHFSNPKWIAAQGGWENPQTIDDFDAFTARAAAAFGDQVDDWLTFNEPTIYAAEGYVDGVFPPGHHGDLGRLPHVLANMVKAHGRAYHTLHEVDVWQAEGQGPAARVGIAEHMVAFHPAWGWNPLDGLMASAYEGWMDFNFLDAATTGKIRFECIAGHDWEDVPWLANTVDFVGVNYYTHAMASVFQPLRRILVDGAPKTDLGLDSAPDGMYDVLVHSYQRYHKPIFVTETGVADEKRVLTPCFMVQYLSNVGRAIQAGVPVQGVYWWSLLDNFEWQNGYHGRFGLLAVDFSKPDRPRHWTPAAGVYARIAKEHAIAPDLLTTYGTGWAIAAPAADLPDAEANTAVR